MVLCLLLYWLSLCLCLLDFCNINMKIVHKDSQCEDDLCNGANGLVFAPV